MLPSYLSSSSDTARLTAEENENLTKEEEVGEVDDPAIEGEKPLPLAGANVMNIILVAAECATWSKTGSKQLTYNLRWQSHFFSWLTDGI